MSKITSKTPNLNNRLANLLANGLSSMWCFWLLSLILIVAAFIQPPQGAYQWVMFVISASFQAVALPVLAFVSNIQGEKQSKVINHTNRIVMEELQIIKQQQIQIKKLVDSENNRFNRLNQDMNEIDSDFAELNKDHDVIINKID